MNTKRPIKFRVWDTQAAKYLEPTVMWSVVGLSQEMIPGQPPYVPFLMVAIYSPESKYVVEQFTGVLDKNGVEVYEGDIVRYPRETPGLGEAHYDTMAVEWEQSFDGFGGVSGFRVGGDYSTKETTEVIGNIHENPELTMA
jgi:uncharacterized phage protein (TIGR01671 family)